MIIKIKTILNDHSVCRYSKKLFLSIVLFIILDSCKKFVNVDPPKTQLISSTVFASDATAIASIVNIYGAMEQNSAYFSCLYLGLSSDELTDNSASVTSNEFSKNSLTSSNVSIQNNFWNAPYKYIYAANSVIEGLSFSTSITSEVKKQLTGEAKFIRAFWNFYLVNLFGDVPVITSTDFNVNKVVARISKADVYQHIIDDLKNAQNLLNEGYVKSDNSVYPTISAERIRPNKWAATALLSKVYLFNGDWVNAELQSTAVINNSSLYNLLPDLNNVFLKNSLEAIWQLMPINPAANTPEGNQFILTGKPSVSSLRASLVNSFDSIDKRKINWVKSIFVSGTTYYYPFKYKIKSTLGSQYDEYSMVLRLAEQYLIRAEARAQLNNISGSQVDINAIKKRAGLTNTTADDKNSLLFVIEQERQHELFTEWGNRWLYLKRTNSVDTLLGQIKAPYWQSTDILYPIPKSELLNNPNLVQNPGY